MQFSKSVGIVLAAAAVALIALVIAGLPAPQEASASNSFAIRGVRVFDGRDVMPAANVVVRDGRIAAVGKAVAIPDDVPVRDGHGKTLLPGLIDAHVHVFDRARRDALRFGVTTELDMFSDCHQLPEAKRQRRLRARTNQADLWSAGTLVTAPGGHGTEYGLDIPTLKSADDAQAFVDARLAEGSDYIKIVDDDGALYGLDFHTLTPDEIAAVIRAAHRRNKMTVIHIATEAAARRAVTAGVDGLAHIFIDRPASDAFVQLAKRHGIFVIATLSVSASAGGVAEGHKLLDDPALKPYITAQQAASLKNNLVAANSHPKRLTAALASVRRLHAAGVPILAGTDAPNPGTAHGVSLHGELSLLVRAGLSPQEALAAATSIPAQTFGLDDRGRIAPGMRADLLLVDGNPVTDITRTRHIAQIWKNGYPVDRRLEPAGTDDQSAPAPPFSDSVLGNFDTRDRAALANSGWQATSDRVRGGKSDAQLTMTEGADKTPGALAVSGTIRAGYVYPWAGVMYFPGSRPMTAVDLGARHRLSFRVRGDGGQYHLMLFSGSRGGMPVWEDFRATADWRRVELDLSDFGGADLHRLRAIGFTAGPRKGAFHFVIDQVELH